MKKPELKKCPAGHRGRLEGSIYSKLFWFGCAKSGTDCWVGPARKTEKEAIRAWNKITGRKGIV